MNLQRRKNLKEFPSFNSNRKYVWIWPLDDASYIITINIQTSCRLFSAFLFFLLSKIKVTSIVNVKSSNSNIFTSTSSSWWSELRQYEAVKHRLEWSIQSHPIKCLTELGFFLSTLYFERNDMQFIYQAFIIDSSYLSHYCGRVLTICQWWSQNSLKCKAHWIIEY